MAWFGSTAKPSPSAPEPDEDELLMAAMLATGFDEVRARFLLDSGVHPDRATALVLVRGCPVELAFEILR